jgi:hypothetical protein
VKFSHAWAGKNFLRIETAIGRLIKTKISRLKPGRQFKIRAPKKTKKHISEKSRKKAKTIKAAKVKFGYKLEIKPIFN